MPRPMVKGNYNPEMIPSEGPYAKYDCCPEMCSRTCFHHALLEQCDWTMLESLCIPNICSSPGHIGMYIGETLFWDLASYETIRWTLVYVRVCVCP